VYTEVSQIFQASADFGLNNSRVGQADTTRMLSDIQRTLHGTRSLSAPLDILTPPSSPTQLSGQEQTFSAGESMPYNTMATVMHRLDEHLSPSERGGLQDKIHTSLFTYAKQLLEDENESKEKKISILKQLLEEDSGILSMKDEDSRNLLHHAIATDAKDIKVLDCLISHLSEDNKDVINNQCCEGNTPIYLAVQVRWVDAVKRLKEHGADIALQNKRNETPLEVANDRDSEIITLLTEDQKHIVGQSELENGTAPENPVPPRPMESENVQTQDKSRQNSFPRVLFRGRTGSTASSDSHPSRKCSKRRISVPLLPGAELSLEYRSFSSL
jgi:hypothetical protein